MSARTVLLDVAQFGMFNLLGKLLWAASLALAMRSLGPDSYGRLVVVWSLAGLLAPLSDLGLSAVLLRDGARDPALVTVLARGALLGRLATGLLITFAAVIWASATGTANAVFVALAIAGPLLDAGFVTATAIAQVRGRIGLLAVWRVAGMAILPASLLVASGLFRETGVAGAWVLASALGLAGFLHTVRPPGGSPSARATLPWRRLLRNGYPFALVGLAAVSYGKLEVIVLGRIATPGDAGLYHAAYQVILLVFSAGEIFFAAVNPHLFRAHGRPARLDQAWRPICRWLCALAAVLVPVLWVHATAIIGTIGGSTFSGAASVLRALVPMVALLPVAAALNMLVLLDVPLRRALLDAACVASTAIIALCLAPIGVGAVAWGASAAYCTTCIVAWQLVKRRGMSMPWVADAVKAMAAATVLGPTLLIPIPWVASSMLYGCLLTGTLLLARYIVPSDLGTLVTANHTP